MKTVKQYIADNSSNDFLYIKFTWQELGLSKQWYEKECRGLDNDRLLIRREIELEWTKSSDNSVFDEEQLDVVFTHLRKPIGTIALSINTLDKELQTSGVIEQKYPLKIYKNLEREKMYFIGVDTGGGLQKDFSTIVVTDPDDLEPVAVFKNNKINTSYFSSLLEILIEQLLPNSILFIENNNYGKGVIDNLLRVIPKSLFYDFKLADKDKSAIAKIFSKRPTTITYGITTTVKTRDQYFDLLNQTIVENPGLIAIDDIYDELKTLVFNNKGKIEHDRNAHDDVLFGYMIVIYAVAYSNNISKFLRDKRDVANKIILTTSKPNTLPENPNSDIHNVLKPSDNIDLQKYIELSMSGLNTEQILAKLKSEKTNNRQLNNDALTAISNFNKRG